jgi:hypothetical protein
MGRAETVGDQESGSNNYSGNSTGAARNGKCNLRKCLLVYILTLPRYCHHSRVPYRHYRTCSKASVTERPVALPPHVSEGSHQWQSTEYFQSIVRTISMRPRRSSISILTPTLFELRSCSDRDNGLRFGRGLGSLPHSLQPVESDAKNEPQRRGFSISTTRASRCASRP